MPVSWPQALYGTASKSFCRNVSSFEDELPYISLFAAVSFNRLFRNRNWCYFALGLAAVCRWFDVTASPFLGKLHKLLAGKRARFLKWLGLGRPSQLNGFIALSRLVIVLVSDSLSALGFWAQASYFRRALMHSWETFWCGYYDSTLFRHSPVLSARLVR